MNELRCNAFTLERYFFALSLVLFHSCVLWGGIEYWPVNGHFVVSAFFILSGYLTFQSYSLHPGASVFYRKRVRRIVPPYIVALLVGFVLAAAVTECPLKEFLFSRETVRYLLANVSFLNFLGPTLPGAFLHNLQPWVNPSLWTLKVEIGFYLILPFLGCCARRYGARTTACALFFVGVVWFATCHQLYRYTHRSLYTFLLHQLPGQFLYFGAGILACTFRQRLKRQALPAFLVGLAGCVLCTRIYELRPLEALFMAVALTGAAHSSSRLSTFSERLPDHTYWIFLLHAPLLQTAAALDLPRTMGHGLALCLVMTVLAVLIAVVRFLPGIRA